MLRLHLTHHGIRRIRDLIVLDEVTQLRSGLLAGHRLIEARRVRHGAHREAHLVGVPVQAPGNLFLGGLAFDLQGQLAHGTADLPDLLRHVYGYPYGAALVRHRALHRLPYPPRGIRGEPEAPIRVELLYGLHQADVALLDQVLEGQPVAPVLFGNADHQPEVLLDKPLPGSPVSGLGPQAEVYLLLVREETALPDVREVLGEELGGLRLPLDLQIFLPLLEIGFQNTLLTTQTSYRKSVLETTIDSTARFNSLNLSEVSHLTVSIITCHCKDTYVHRHEIVACALLLCRVSVPCGEHGYTWTHGEYLPHSGPHKRGRRRYCGLLADEQAWRRRRWDL